MKVKGLGYMGVSATHTDEWASFATQLLGAQCVDRTSTSLSLRIDDHARRIVIDTSLAQGSHYVGWEVEDRASLHGLASRLEAAGVRVVAGTPGMAEQRGVQELVRFEDPAGNAVELFHGPLRGESPFVPSRPISGFRTGGLGLGHAVLTVANAAPMLAFYKDLLGFQLSDFMLAPFRAYFLHLNQRHHSLALIETGANGFHHLMLELLSLDDVGQAWDIAQLCPDRVGVTLGRHSNDFMTSFYVRSPSAFMIEYGWGGRSIDPLTWQPSEFFHGASLWGHERYWLPPEKRREALEMRLRAAADGFRAPVHVLEDRCVVMPNS